MTKTLKTAIKELEKQPVDVQETWGTRILEALETTSQAEQAKPYSSFEVLKNAHLDGPLDASVTYESKLYGRVGKSDE